MCAPLALGGLQVASQIAGAAAQARQFRHEAQRVERAARADAAAAAARAEFARDEAERRSATARARALTGVVDLKSESALASLAEGHARHLDPALVLENEAARALDAGALRVRDLRLARRQAMARSLLGMVSSKASGTVGAMRIPP